MLSCARSVQPLSTLDHTVYKALDLFLLLGVSEQQECVEVAVSCMSEHGSNDALLLDVNLWA